MIILKWIDLKELNVVFVNYVLYCIGIKYLKIDIFLRFMFLVFNIV